MVTNQNNELGMIGGNHNNSLGDRLTCDQTELPSFQVDDFIRSDMVVGVGAGDGSLAALHHMAAKLEAGSLKNVQVVCT